LKFSFNWLTEFVEGAGLPPKELGRLITMQTAECEGVETAGEDSIIEIDNKSLTHRPDLWGHHGLAREVAAITGGRLWDPVRMELLPAGAPAIEVAIEDLGLCPRYNALTFENVAVGPSPSWLQERLLAIGLNPINNIVDVTNYVMAEIAQPMHAFDWDLLRGSTIFVRRARAGERLVALNQEEYQLDPRDLVIADERGPIAIAGVIGGLDTGIHEGTRRLVLESANFLAASVRKTSSRQKLRTDASMRFEKAQDPHNTVRGLARALELLEQVSPGIRLVGGVADAKRDFASPPPITLPMDWLARKLGRAIEMPEVVRILESLAFDVTETSPQVLSVTVPSWRATRDISIKDDLVEEVGRMIGYGSIPIQPPALPVVPPRRNEERLFHREVRAALVELGFTEVYNYSFVNEEEVRALGLDPADHVKVTNPISSDQGLMRTSLLAGIRRNINQNVKQFDEFRLFEIGREIHRQPAGLPQEIPHLAAVVSARDDGRAGLMELKRVAEHLMPGCEMVPAEPRSYEHPVRAAEVHWQGQATGRLFELHPSLVETGRAAVMDVDLAVLQALSAAGERRYVPIRRYPSSAFDLSVVAGLREPAGDIQKKLSAYAGADLVSIEFQREYTGPPLPENAKSVSFRLTVAAADRTLSSDEVSAIRARVIDAMRGEGYELRV
jgi:phenylalanyl-tRNA synthetase beta chain